MHSCAQSFYKTSKGTKHLKMFYFCVKNILTILIKNLHLHNLFHSELFSF